MTAHARTPQAGDESGFTLIEVMITTGILMAVSGIVMSGVLNMTQLNKTVTNRTAMFAGVRNATALLQQEVGQAGRITLPTGTKLTADVASGTNVALTLNSTTGMFPGEQIIVGPGSAGGVVIPQETITISAVNSATSLTAVELLNAHVLNEPITVQGAFSSGVIPKSIGVNGSGDWVLKILGDINGTGDMVYVEYTCDIANGRLYRNQMAWNAGAKPAPTVDQILIENVQPNPGNAPCFVYQEKTVTNVPFVVGVAITLTVQSQERDPITKTFQKESKALLNVSPRNVFNAWELASLDIDNRVQPLPPTVVQNLLPPLAVVQ